MSNTVLIANISAELERLETSDIKVHDLCLAVRKVLGSAIPPLVSCTKRGGEGYLYRLEPAKNGRPAVYTYGVRFDHGAFMDLTALKNAFGPIQIVHHIDRFPDNRILAQRVDIQLHVDAFMSLKYKALTTAAGILKCDPSLNPDWFTAGATKWLRNLLAQSESGATLESFAEMARLGLFDDEADLRAWLTTPKSVISSGSNSLGNTSFYVTDI